MDLEINKLASHELQHNPVHVNLEASPIVFSGAYFQVNVHKIARGFN